MTAPELSAREREVAARFEAAKYPPEVAVAALLAEFWAAFEPAVARVADLLSRLAPGGKS